MCSITPETANVCCRYNRMQGPGIGCWFSDRSNCSHSSLTPAFTLTSDNLSLYTTLLLLLVLIQLCSPRFWYFDSNYCRTRCRQSQPRFVLSTLLLHPRLLGTFQSDIPLFTLTWSAKHSIVLINSAEWYCACYVLYQGLSIKLIESWTCFIVEQYSAWVFLFLMA